MIRVMGMFWMSVFVLLLLGAQTVSSSFSSDGTSSVQQQSIVETSAIAPKLLIRDYHSYQNVSLGGASCSSMTSCSSCANTYTCHWCDFDQECHVKGSVYGCKWGDSCHKQPSKPKENTTCASHDTCSECALASSFCHWCEGDNACHAKGSRYGCAIGVDCYSNERCRRPEPEEFHRFVLTEIPTSQLYVVVGVGSLLILLLTGCHVCFGNVKGAYDDLATLSVTASSNSVVAPPSSVGGGGTVMMEATEQPFYQTLQPHTEDDDQEGADEEGARGNALDTTGETMEGDELQPSSSPESPLEEGELQTDYSRLNEMGDEQRGMETMPFLTPSGSSTTNPRRRFNGVPGMEEPPHMARLYRMWSCCCCLSVFLVLALMGSAIFFYPKRPVYNVCSDAVAWKKIIKNVVAMKLDASFEILISVENANHVSVDLTSSKGSFTFEGNPVGTYEIPAGTVEAMSVTDLMIISRVTPTKHQALQMGQAYHRGKLFLEAEFEGTLRVPALMGFEFSVQLQKIPVYVNEISDRSLCHCPTWDDSKNHSSSSTSLAFF